MFNDRASRAWPAHLLRVVIVMGVGALSAHAQYDYATYDWASDWLFPRQPDVIKREGRKIAYQTYYTTDNDLMAYRTGGSHNPSRGVEVVHNGKLRFPLDVYNGQVWEYQVVNGYMAHSATHGTGEFGQEWDYSTYYSRFVFKDNLTISEPGYLWRDTPKSFQHHRVVPVFDKEFDIQAWIFTVTLKLTGSVVLDASGTDLTWYSSYRNDIGIRGQLDMKTACDVALTGSFGLGPISIHIGLVDPKLTLSHALSTPYDISAYTGSATTAIQGEFRLQLKFVFRISLLVWSWEWEYVYLDTGVLQHKESIGWDSF